MRMLGRGVLVLLVAAVIAAGLVTARDTSATAVDTRVAARTTPAIPRPPIPSFLRTLFRTRPRYVPRVRPRAPRPHVPATSLRFDVLTLKYAATTEQARRALRTILAKGDYEKMSVHAFCWGVDELSNYLFDPAAYFSENTWRSIFYSFMRANIEAYYVPRAVQVVNSWVSIWSMAQINPRLALFYYRACY